VTDVDAGLRAYYAVPQPDGSMKKINMPSTPAINKYQRPAFGDGRLYLSTSDGHIICLGSPVAQPFTCSVPIDFGSVIIGSTATLMINCTANIPITEVIGLTLTSPLFTALNSSLPTGPLATGQQFSFPATFNLTTASIQNTVNTSYSGVKPGVASGAITLFTVNGVAGYSPSQPLAVSGKTVSQTGFLSLSPVEVDFGGLVVNSAAAQSGLSGSLIISNIGSASLTITGSAWSDLQSNTPAYTNITQIGTTGQYALGPAFNATNWPQPGYVIAGGASISVTLNFVANTVGTYGSLITIWSTGASSQNVILTGTMSNAPMAVLTVDNGEGGAWQPDITGTTQDPSDGSTITEVGVDFGNLYPGNSTIYSKLPTSEMKGRIDLDRNSPQ
jgi:iron transport multicopper oxidase